MRVNNAQAAQSRERILDVAAKRFRERGLDGIGVADLMKDAGFTHGGFYAHFGSKEDLMAEACARALAGSLERLQLVSTREPHPLTALARSYLTTRHRDNPGGGCAIASIGGEVPRHSAPVRRSFTDGVRALVEGLSRLVPERTKAARRRKALSLYSSMVGAMVLARAVDDGAMSQEILDAMTAEIEAYAR